MSAQSDFRYGKHIAMGLAGVVIAGVSFASLDRVRDNINTKRLAEYRQAIVDYTAQHFTLSPDKAFVIPRGALSLRRGDNFGDTLNFGFFQRSGPNGSKIIVSSDGSVMQYDAFETGQGFTPQYHGQMPVPPAKRDARAITHAKAL